jgi:S-adenosylmethionine synthetase
LRVEQHLNSASLKAAHPEIGEDIKIMGIRKADTMHLTISCAFIDRFVASMQEYCAARRRVAQIASQIGGQFTNREIVAIVNAADDIAAESFF